MKKFLFILTLMLICSTVAWSQGIKWKPTKSQLKSYLYPSISPQINIIPTSPAFLPEYAKKNPSGYSYLCRLELKIEDKLPVPMWIKLGDNSSIHKSQPNQAYVRFKLKRF